MTDRTSPKPNETPAASSQQQPGLLGLVKSGIRARVARWSEQTQQEGELGGFFAALWHVKLKSAIAFFSGFFLLKVSTHFASYPVLGPLLDHLGMALLVCSIAIFGYEWHSHQKQIDKLAQKLSASIQTASEMQKLDIERFEEQLPRVFPNGEKNALVKPLTELVTKAQKLASAPGWTEKFVARMLSDVVVKNADQLGNLGQETGDYRGGITVTETKAADRMLMFQMEELVNGDAYNVISDLKSWKEQQLEDFRKASIDATKRGVTVRRIFNLVEEDLENMTTAEEAIKILREHLEDSSKCNGKYEVKAFFEKDLEQPLLKEKLIGQQLEKLRDDHFGIFTVKGEGLRVEAKESLPLRLTTDKEQVEKCQARFDAAWEAISPLDKQWIDEWKKRISAPQPPSSGERLPTDPAKAAAASGQIH